MNKSKAVIGLILCKCGTNISNAVDLEAVTTWAQENKNLDFVLSHELLCSLAGRAYVKELLQKENPDHLVIAACSPRLHEATFRNIALEAGSNITTIYMANIREDSAWVTPDKNEATKKSIALINAALERSALHEKLTQKSMECITDIVVIGGGIAGIEAALLASQAGRKVTIIEKNITLGGRVIQIEELAPHMECAPCLLSPRLFKIKDDPNITVLTNAEITNVLGFQGNFTVKVHKKARYVNKSCIGCEACLEACPVSVKSEFHLGLGQRKAIYTLFPGAVPAMAAIDQENCLHFKADACNACVSACPLSSIDFEEKDEDLEISAGAIILATGFTLYDPSGIERLGYGRIADVYTLAEFERIANSNGPYQGQLKLKNGTSPQSVAVIHCAGSLSHQPGLAYCSGICCLSATKVGEIMRKQNSQAKVYNIHHRLVLEGQAANEFYEEQVKAGTQFIMTNDLAGIIVSPAQDKIQVQVPGLDPLPVDMVVLATGLLPPADAKDTSELLCLDRAESGFYKPDHHFLRSLGTSLDGIYMVGGCAGPCLAHTAVVQAQAAAGEAISRLVPGRRIDLEIMTSVIDPDACAGCKMCIAVCPYHAISYNTDKSICEINEAICRGCGTCVANCPSGAAQAKHFTSEQILAELEGLLHANL